MTFTLDQVRPWGRLFEEYERMFTLTAADLQSHILGCGDGPASFNAEASRAGSRVVSCDPLYQFDAGQVRRQVGETRAQMMEQTRRHQHEFVWTMIKSPEELDSMRMTALETFLADYEAGKAEGRYVAAELPRLPFADQVFDLALCSHFLFLYSEQLTEAFHEHAILEMCRVAREVRIFPLLKLGATPSPHVEPVAESLRRRGFEVSVEVVPYEFQRGGNQMMRVRRVAAT